MSRVQGFHPMQRLETRQTDWWREPGADFFRLQARDRLRDNVSLANLGPGQCLRAIAADPLGGKATSRVDQNYRTDKNRFLGALARPESFSCARHRSVIGLNPLVSAATQSPTLSIILQAPLGSRPEG